MNYKELNDYINKTIGKKNIFTKDDIIDYVKLINVFNKFTLRCNGIEINSVQINTENQSIDFNF